MAFDLKKFNVNDLAKMAANLPDLRTLKPEDILAFLKRHAMIMIGVLIFFVCGYMAWNIVTTRMEDLETKKVLAGQLREKEEPIKKYKKIVDKNEAFLKTIPEGVPENLMITQLTKIATGRDVQILSFDLKGSEEGGFYRKVKVRFSCSTPSFQAAMLFISDIENSDVSMRVDSWSSGGGQGGGSKRGKAAHAASTLTEGFDINLDVSSIEIINDASRKPKKS
ncbi:MAG: hypothetical protein HQL19_03145 [Candidatus Omnitrophica bacterium]|nr:hypothetical protein [Candidatus Omnitrophota bacterium]